MTNFVCQRVRLKRPRYNQKNTDTMNTTKLRANLRTVMGNLLTRIIIAILLGIALAYVLPLWAVRVFETFNAVFAQFLSFMIPLIILGFVAPAIADVGGRAGKMLIATVALAYGATLFAGFGSFFVSDWIFPHIITAGTVSGGGDAVASIDPYFTIQMPALMPVTSALILAFLLGLGVAALPDNTVFKGLLDQFRGIVQMVIERAILPLLPVFIFGIFLNMTVTGQVAHIMATFAKIIVVIFAMHVAILLIQYGVAALFSRGSHNPFKLLGTMLPAYFTALGTQSSAATIPVTLRQTVKMGVDENVASFTVPLCATIHMSGSTLKIVACAVALMLSSAMPYTLSMFAGFICMLGITIIAAPGIPGGVIMASLGVLSSMLGFNEADNALMIALYVAMDSFGTACNVTGDGALSIIINRFFGKRPPAN